MTRRPPPRRRPREIEIRRLGFRRRLRDVQQEKLTDESSTRAAFVLDPVEGLGSPDARAIARELQGHAEPRQRRTQLVRNIPQ